MPSSSASAPPEPEESDEAESLAAVQRRLAELKYYVGPVDGGGGGGTRSAVLAFQKVNRLGADGVLGTATLAALDDPVSPRLRGGPARRVEIDLDRQVLYYVEGGRLARILPISSGNGSNYEQEDG
ncbi:MAG: peptidoglycan-binding protein, partial [Pseudonocardiaceae bacterium]